MLSAGVGVLLFLPVHLQLANCSLSAFHVIIGALKEQELRLVTNLTKLRSGRSMTQQDPAFWLEAISCRVCPQATVRVTREDGGWSQRLLRSQPPTIEPRGVEGHGYNNPGSIKVWLMPFFLGLMSTCCACCCLGMASWNRGMGHTDPQQAPRDPHPDSDFTVESVLQPNVFFPKSY